MNAKKIISAAAMGVLLSSFVVAAPAVAGERTDVERWLAAVEAVAPEVLASPAAARSLPDGELEAATIIVPEAAGEPATISFLEREVEIGLPFAEHSSDGVDGPAGVTAFDNNNGSATIPVEHEDGSLQILTVIEEPAAPTRYDYQITIPEGGSSQLLDNGAVLVTDAVGNFVAAVAPAWAKDANGSPVSTRYELSEGTLTQVIEHNADTPYPVVADPWLGIQLFHKFSRTTWSNASVYNGQVTVPGVAVLQGGLPSVGSYLVGQAIFRGNGWDEWVANWPVIANSAHTTVHQQYDCHVTAGSAGLPFTGAYNLENARAPRANWGIDVAVHHCNW